MDSRELQQSVFGFLESYTRLEVLHRLWKDKGIDSTDVEGKGWPEQFNQDVDSSLRKLMKEYEKLRQRSSSTNRRRLHN